jgi:hypothetical protein
MNMPAFFRRFAWINLPATLLVTLLQRTPAVRLFVAASDYVLTSPVGQLLRGAATVATLGALHSRAGATTFILSPTSPITGTVGTPLSAGFTYSGTPSSPASFSVSGSLPPGLSFIPAPVGGTIRSGTPAISGTPTASGTFLIQVQGFNAEGLTNNVQQEIVFIINPGGAQPVAPSISAQPQNQTSVVGGAVTFSVSASGTPTPTFQWRKDGANIAGATGNSLALTNVQATDAGIYTVVITNSAGTVTSSPVTLTVNTAAVPLAITAQPASQTVAANSTVVFNVAATGATGYQWRRSGVNIAGATSPTLVINNATTASAGVYTVIVMGEGGATATSSGATLAISNDSNFGRLINLSILTDIPAPGEAGAFTMGYVVGGAGTNGNKPLVIRAAGPSLGALGVPGTVLDPKLELFAGSTKTGDNDNWGGSAQLAASLAAVGAFPYASAASLDAAVASSIPRGDNSVKVSATGSGTVISEIYDATASGTFSASTPRLINVSVNKVIPTGAKLTVGFVVGGGTARTVLVRAIGPGLAAFGVPGTIADPKLTLFNSSSAKIAENDNWGGTTAIATVAAQVGAFVIPNNSNDAVLLLTLAPGNYSAEVSGTGAGGTALVEVYEVP